MTKVYLPWLGEFGSELLRWVPKVNADNDEKIVCYEKGKECLYPTGTSHVVQRIKEQERKCAGSINQNNIFDEIKQLYPCCEYIMPSTTDGLQYADAIFDPVIKNEYDFDCDIAIFPRWRHNSKRLNWEGWINFLSLLRANGYSVFACGHPDSSFKLNCPCAWDYNNPLEASIWAIKHSKIRIGLMTALTVLSLYCEKRPWILTTERGMKCNIGKDAPSYNYFWFADWKKVGWRTYPFLNNYIKMIPFIEEQLCVLES